MLRELHIRNFTLIDELDVGFGPGFSAITGETGAGKSVILGAVNLLLGQRADARSLRPGSRSCVVEAHFRVDGYGLEGFFEDNGIDYDPEDCIMRREVTQSGKSRAFINDTPVQLGLMRALGGRLVDVHGQHQGQSLALEGFQLRVVDTMAGDADALAAYREAFGAYREARAATLGLVEAMDRARRDEDYLRHQLGELSGIGLKEGMQEELEAESLALGHAEEIRSALCSAVSILDPAGASEGVLDRLGEAARLLGGIRDFHGGAGALADRIDGCRVELRDVSRDISSMAEDADSDPRRLEAVDALLGRIYDLERKYGLATVGELVRLREDVEGRLGRIEDFDRDLAVLRAREKGCLETCTRLADALSARRKEAAALVEREMRGMLVGLGIPDARFLVGIEPGDLSESGRDRVTFLFSANRGSEPLPISQVASGGEASRVMLSIKAMTGGAEGLPTMVFDEIDTGVSGRVAERMGEIMLGMALGNRQVISITHLPQIAARATAHFKVAKVDTPAGARTTMRLLDGGERVGEIAQMLSGAEVTAAALDNARELLNCKGI